jgi:hypothetical protein
MVAVLSALVFISAEAFGLPVYNGSLSTPSGVTGTGIWASDFQISWEVGLQDGGYWEYSYFLTETDGSPLDPGAVSHWIVEVSPNATLGDFWGFTGSVELGDWQTEAGFPFENGLKLDYGDEGQTEWTFFSYRTPVWGDFFAKDGRAGGQGLNTAWNAGFFDTDPIDAPSDGSFGYKILRPDTGTTVIPEPTTVGLLGLGLVGLAARLRRSK